MYEPILSSTDRTMTYSQESESEIDQASSHKEGILDKTGDKCTIFLLGHQQLIPWFSGLRASDLTLRIANY